MEWNQFDQLYQQDKASQQAEAQYVTMAAMLLEAAATCAAGWNLEAPQRVMVEINRVATASRSLGDNVLAKLPERLQDGSFGGKVKTLQADLDKLRGEVAAALEALAELRAKQAEMLALEQEQQSLQAELLRLRKLEEETAPAKMAALRCQLQAAALSYRETEKKLDAAAALLAEVTETDGANRVLWEKHFQADHIVWNAMKRLDFPGLDDNPRQELLRLLAAVDNDLERRLREYDEGLQAAAAKADDIRATIQRLCMDKLQLAGGA